jgi:hypothetical protein
MNTKSFRNLALGPVFLAAIAGLGLALSGCVVDTTSDGSYGYGCQSDLVVDWQIQNVAGGSVTCDAINPAQVVIDIDGVKYPQICPAGYSYGDQDILLQQNYASYSVTVNLEDMNGTALAVPQVTNVNVASCGTYYTPGPALLVVTLPAQ